MPRRASRDKVDILLLVMWPAIGMLVAGGLTALALRWRVLLKTFKSLSAATPWPATSR